MGGGSRTKRHRRLARRTIDEAALLRKALVRAQPMHEVREGGLTVAQRVRENNLVKDLGAVGGGAHDPRVAEAELGHNIVRDAPRGRRGERHQRRAPGQRVAKGASKLEVAGAEVVPPRGYAVGLVDGHAE